MQIYILYVNIQKNKLSLFCIKVIINKQMNLMAK